MNIARYAVYGTVGYTLFRLFISKKSPQDVQIELMNVARIPINLLTLLPFKAYELIKKVPAYKQQEETIAQKTWPYFEKVQEIF